MLSLPVYDQAACPSLAIAEIHGSYNARAPSAAKPSMPAMAVAFGAAPVWAEAELEPWKPAEAEDAEPVVEVAMVVVPLAEPLADDVALAEPVVELPVADTDAVEAEAEPVEPDADAVVAAPRVTCEVLWVCVVGVLSTKGGVKLYSEGLLSSTISTV